MLFDARLAASLNRVNLLEGLLDKEAA